MFLFETKVSAIIFSSNLSLDGTHNEINTAASLFKVIDSLLQYSVSISNNVLAFASSFSNAAESYKSSLGFYATGEIYSGKHGMSLKLDGLEKGINDNARNRGVVMHAAEYVSNSFVKNNHRLGRSQGCPAVPVELSKDIINAIKDKSCFFIYHPSRAFKLESELIS